MTLTVEQLSSFGRFLNIYVGLFMLGAGLLGSCINLWLFTRHRFRKSPCSRFIVASSIFDFIHLIVALLFRILANGFNIDPASSSVIGCRIRYYLITFSAYSSVGCRCLAAFDRYACTSRSTEFRQWSSFKVAERFLLGNIFLWACFALPNLFFFNLVPIDPTNMICSISKRTYSYYFAYFVNPVLYFALPLLILISFSIRTHENLRRMSKTRRIKQLERQITKMIILQALTNSISSIPYGVQYLYAAITFNLTKDKYQLAQEHLFLQITRLSYYINFISAFYIYYISSQHIRSTIRCQFINEKHTNEKDDILLQTWKRQLSKKSIGTKKSNAKPSFFTDKV